MAARITQLVLEVSHAGAAAGRVTQLVLEVAHGGPPAARITQVVAETAYAATPLARVTQVVAEVPYAATPQARVTQVVLEVVYPNDSPVAQEEVGAWYPEYGPYSPVAGPWKRLRRDAPLSPTMMMPAQEVVSPAPPYNTVGPYRGMPGQKLPTFPYEFVPEPEPTPIPSPPPDYSLTGTPVPGPWKRTQLLLRQYQVREVDYEPQGPSQSAVTAPREQQGPKSPVPGPWNSFLMPSPPNSRTPPQQAPPTPTVNRPGGSEFRITRVPRDVKQTDPRRRRASEEIAIVVNSLFERGHLLMTGLREFTVLNGAITGTGVPDQNVDILDGAVVGCFYIDTVGQAAYICISNAVGAAVWKQVTP